MKTEILNFKDIKTNLFSLEDIPSKMNLSEVFAEKTGSYLNEFNLFLLHFNAIPNFIRETNIDCRKANKWLYETYKSEIKDLYYDKRIISESIGVELDDIYYVLYNELIIAFDIGCGTVNFLFRTADAALVENLIKGIRTFKYRKSRGKPQIFLLINTNAGIATKPLPIPKLKLKIIMMILKKYIRPFIKGFQKKMIRDLSSCTENLEPVKLHIYDT